MSSRWSREATYQCGGCDWGSCPGHTIRLQYHHTSDTVLVHIDGKPERVYSDDEFAALRQLADELDQEATW